MGSDLPVHQKLFQTHFYYTKQSMLNFITLLKKNYFTDFPDIMYKKNFYFTLQNCTVFIDFSCQIVKNITFTRKMEKICHFKRCNVFKLYFCKFDHLIMKKHKITEKYSKFRRKTEKHVILQGITVFTVYVMKTNVLSSFCLRMTKMLSCMFDKKGIFRKNI